MSTEAPKLYVPPHLRGQAVQISAPSAAPQSRGPSRMSSSYSVPDNLNRITDSEIRTLFEANSVNTDIEVYDSGVVNIHAGDQLEPIAEFTGCGVRNEILRNIAQLGYKSPTAVQRYSIPYVIHGDDLIVTAQTGSGKTAAFMLPALTQIMTHRSSGSPRILVLTPTRELALQIKSETDKFCRGTANKTVCVYGGASIGDQIRNLHIPFDVLVATPGRLIDVMDRNKLSLAGIQFLILDEADRMLDMGFEPQISQILRTFDMPLEDHRQTLLFSATFPHEVQSLAQSFMRPTYARIEVGIQDAPSLIKQRFVYVPDNMKLSALLDYIKEVDGPTLVFAERKVSVDSVEEFLYDQGENVVAIHGDRDMRDRLAALRGFTNGKAKVMVATDVAARGIDIPNVAHVINLDLPGDMDSYVHRIGRTGRAGKHGIATSFYNEGNTPLLMALIQHIRSTNQEMPEGLEEFENSHKEAGRGGNGRRGGRRGMSRDRSYHNIAHY